MSRFEINEKGFTKVCDKLGCVPSTRYNYMENHDKGTINKVIFPDGSTKIIAVNVYEPEGYKNPWTGMSYKPYKYNVMAERKDVIETADEFYILNNKMDTAVHCTKKDFGDISCKSETQTCFAAYNVIRL